MVKKEQMAAFAQWQARNRYFGKKFSIMGDSISTLAGYNPQSYKVYYENEICTQTGVKDVNDTWWGKVIRYFGGELLVNASYSGSWVTKLPGASELFPSGCSDERIAALQRDSVKPDVIIVYLGTNDWAFGAKLGDIEDDMILSEDDFSVSYCRMLSQIRSNYPESEILCCTLCRTCIPEKPDFRFPYEPSGAHIERYNNVIRSSAASKGCGVIDLYKMGLAYETLDGTHPTSQGMLTITMMVIRAMAGEEADAFLDCEEEQHKLVKVEAYTGGIRYTCTRCGKTVHMTTLDPMGDAAPKQTDHWFDPRRRWDNGEYVMLDRDITSVLYNGTLQLTISATGRKVEFNKTEVRVGRDSQMDLHLTNQPHISRHHATFIYEDKSWFLRDNNSYNGTWLNGQKIQPWKKYQLAANDEISFAKSESVIFAKYDGSFQTSQSPEEKKRTILESAIRAFVKSDYQDEASFKLVIAMLREVPMYIPMGVDVAAMLGGLDPTKLKAGDTFTTQSDVKMHILTLTGKDGTEFVPLFTSDEEGKKGPAASMIRFQPKDYVQTLLQMQKAIVINPFSEYRFFLSFELVKQLLPALVADPAIPPKPPLPKDDRIGMVIDGKYEILRSIHTGSASRTYLARDVRTNKNWLVKICRRGSARNLELLRESILTECHMLMKLNHPAIPRVLDVYDTPDSVYIVREYFEGETLETALEMFGAQPADKVVGWGKQLCDVLGYLHSRTPAHIHRDIKPSNLILRYDGTLGLIDFGTMRTYKPNQPGDTCCLGTLGYAAPEQFGTAQSDARTDIYALGMTMYHLVTGKDPRKDPHISKSICDADPSLPRGLDYIISKCTKANPQERYQTCAQLQADLDNYQNLPKPQGLFSKFFGKK